VGHKYAVAIAFYVDLLPREGTRDIVVSPYRVTVENQTQAGRRSSEQSLKWLGVQKAPFLILSPLGSDQFFENIGLRQSPRYRVYHESVLHYAECSRYI
jgi:hypothetical protein